MARNDQPTGWVGWVYFAGVLLLVRAFFQALLGIVALMKEDFYVVTPEHLAVFNFTAWGWVHLALAVVLFTAGFSVLHGGMWGRVVAMVAVGLSLLANLAFLPAYPVWAIAAIAIDMLMLYALTVHGREARD